MDYSAANTSLWNPVIQLGIVAALIILSNILRRKVKFIKRSLMPTAVIAGFVLLGNTNLTNYCAKVLGDKIKDVDFDYIVCPEAKTLPLAPVKISFCFLDVTIPLTRSCPFVTYIPFSRLLLP